MSVVSLDEVDPFGERYTSVDDMFGQDQEFDLIKEMSEDNADFGE